MNIPPDFVRILRYVYRLQASICIISGYWDTGKTDFSLRIAETLLSLNLIKSVASNIQSITDPRVMLIQSLTRLKLWFYQTRLPKLFIYDEPIESTPKRKAMSNLNIEWIRAIPQLSKARGHLLICTQEENLTESAFFNPTFCRGIWTKLSKKKALFHSRLIERIGIENPYILEGIPKTTINFDRYVPATFQVEEEGIYFRTLGPWAEAMKIYGNKGTLEDIKTALKLDHRTQALRLVRKGCKIFVTMLHKPSEGKKAIEIGNELED